MCIRDRYGEELVHECLLLSEERETVAHGTAEDTTDDGTCLGIARKLSVGDGEGDGADVFGNYTHGDVRLLIFAILLACHVSDGFQYRDVYKRQEWGTSKRLLLYIPLITRIGLWLAGQD